MLNALLTATLAEITGCISIGDSLSDEQKNIMKLYAAAFLLNGLCIIQIIIILPMVILGLACLGAFLMIF